MEEVSPCVRVESISMSTAASNSPSLLYSARTMAGDIKIAHSVFALPFALLAAFMAASATTGTPGWSRFSWQILLVVLAMILARTWAMLANRLLDRRLDSLNPRTSGRAIPSGRLRVRHAVFGLACSGIGFLVVCSGFLLVSDNPWPILLALPVLLWIGCYPLAKRFTFLCHAWLGSSLAMSPLAAALAIEPNALLVDPALWMLSGMVLAWVTGFDVLYSLQDVEVDTAQELHSMPARLGVRNALWISRLLHVAAAGLLLFIDLGLFFFIASLATCLLLAWEHLVIARWGTQRMTMAFFTLNGVISCVLGVAGILDILLPA